MFKNTSIKHIFFDLDHTLWDFDTNSALAFSKAFKEHQIALELDAFLEIYEPINANYWKLYREERVTKEELRRGRLLDTFTQLQHSFPLEVVDRLAVAYIDYLPDNNFLFPGAIELLDYLYPNYKLHIITNGFDEVQRKKIQNAKIDTYFSTITNSEMAGVKKPNPKIFHHALKLANASPRESLMIGDNLEADILGAEAVGMHTLLFNYKKAENPYPLSVSALSAIKELL